MVRTLLLPLPAITCTSSQLTFLCLLSVMLRSSREVGAMCMTRSRRRARLSSLYFVLLVVQLVNACVYLIPNAYVLGGQCRWYEPIIQWCGVIRWTCWNTACAQTPVHYDLPVLNMLVSCNGHRVERSWKT